MGLKGIRHNWATKQPSTTPAFLWRLLPKQPNSFFTQFWPPNLAHNQRHFNKHFKMCWLKMATWTENTSLLFLWGWNCQRSEPVKIPNVMFGVEFSQTYREPVPGMRCAGEGSNPPVSLHGGPVLSVFIFKKPAAHLCRQEPQKGGL